MLTTRRKVSLTFDSVSCHILCFLSHTASSTIFKKTFHKPLELKCRSCICAVPTQKYTVPVSWASVHF